MPRIEFGNKKAADSWIKNHIEGKKYEAYYTRDSELILVPTKSTQPIVYGYVKMALEEEVKDLMSKGVTVYWIDKFEWNSDRGMPKE